MSKLQQLREEAGFVTVESLAVRADVSPSTVRRAEDGGRIRRSNALRIAHVLGKSLDDLDIEYVGKGPVHGNRATERLETV